MTTLSISGAARLLNVSQPGVSRLIKHLEQRLGVALFERDKSRLHPTPEAEVLFKSIEEVYRGVEEVTYVSERLRHGAFSRLKIISATNASLSLVPEAIASTTKAHPGARITFFSIPTNLLASSLLKSDANIAVYNGQIAHASIHSQEVTRWRLMLAIPRDHPEVDRPSFSFTDVAGGNLIFYTSDAPHADYLMNEAKRRGVEIRRSLEVASAYSACALVAAGAGVAVVDGVTARVLESPRIVFKPIDLDETFPLSVAYNKQRPLPVFGQYFIDTLREAAARGSLPNGLASFRSGQVHALKA